MAVDSSVQQPGEQRISRATSVLSYIILFGGILTIMVALYATVVSYSTLPFWDEWNEIQFSASGNSPLSPVWVWAQHNEHRLVVPKLFLAADLLLFKGQEWFLLGTIFAIQFLHWWLLIWSMRVLGKWRGTLLRTGAGLAAFCLFCPSQWENFTWGFQVCFVLPQLLATLSFVMLLLYWRGLRDRPEKPQSRYLVVSLFAAVGATYSLASGALLWPLLIAGALFLRLRPSAVLSVIATSLISLGLYFHHYVRPPNHADPIASLRQPLLIVGYCAEYFFSSWLHRDVLRTEALLLFVLAIAISYLFLDIPYIKTLQQIKAFGPFVIQLLLMAAFYVGTAFVTATGRLNFGIGESSVSRYQTVALLCWCCLGLLLLGATFSVRSRKPQSFLLAQLCILVIFVRGAIILPYPLTDARLHGFKQRTVSAAVMTEIYDLATISATYSLVDVAISGLPFIKANHLSVFSNNTDSGLGKFLTVTFPNTSSANCAGVLESAKTINGVTGKGMRLEGWAWDLQRSRPADAVVVVNNGIITGLGAAGGWRSDVPEVHPGITPSLSGFVAFAPQPKPGSKLDLYAILRRNPPVACYLATGP